MKAKKISEEEKWKLITKKLPSPTLKLIRILTSNCTLLNGTPYPTYRKPFDIIAKGFTRQNWLHILDNFRILHLRFEKSFRMAPREDQESELFPYSSFLAFQIQGKTGNFCFFTRVEHNLVFSMLFASSPVSFFNRS